MKKEIDLEANKSFTYVEIYKLYIQLNSRRRIATLPDVDDDLIEMIKSRYTYPFYTVRVIRVTYG